MKNHAFRQVFLIATLFTGLIGAPPTARADSVKPILPRFDALKGDYSPSGDKAWLPTGFFEWPAAITATAVTKNGRHLIIGDDSGFVGVYDLEKHRTTWRKQLYPDGEVRVLSPDPAGDQVAVATRMGVNDARPWHLVSVATGKATPFSPEKSPNPACASLEMATLDPIQFAWSPDGATLYTLYVSHMQANRDQCQIAVEQYLYLRNFDRGKVSIRSVILDAFAKPEGDEPDTPWCLVPIPFMSLSPDGAHIAVTMCNTRVVVYPTKGGKIGRAKVSRAIYKQLEQAGFSASGSGAVLFRSASSIFYSVGSTGTLAKTYLVETDAAFKKKPRVLAEVGQPLPIVSTSPDGRLVMLGRDRIDVWDLETKNSVVHGPRGKYSAHLAQFHPKKRAILLPVGTRVHLLVERPRSVVSVGTEWTKTGRFVFFRDSFSVRGESDVGYGFGAWLREDWKSGGFTVNDGLSDQVSADDVNEEGEISLRAKTAGDFALYGGRSTTEGKTLESLITALPEW